MSSQSIYAFYRDRSKYELNGHLDDIESNKNSIAGIMNDLDTIDGRLDGIDQSISSMGDTISVITSSLGAAKTDISTLQTNVSTLQTNVSTLQTNVSTLTNRVTPIAKGGTGSTTARAARHALGLNFDSGDVISGTFYGAGYVTGSGKYFVFEIPLSKVVDGSLSLVSISVTIRQGGNYIFGSGSGAQDVKSITTLTKMNGGIRIELQPSSMPANTINNDVFGVVCTVKINIT